MLEKYSDKLEFHRYGIISMLIILVSCLGGISIAGVLDKMFLVIPIIISTMLVESMILAVQPMTTIVKLSIASLLISTLALFF